jgi:hypothetical protein
MFGICCEWDFGQEQMVFTTEEKAWKWLYSNERLIQWAALSNRSVEEFVKINQFAFTKRFIVDPSE